MDQRVQGLQELLIKAGAAIKADGVWGPASLNALKEFQRSHGLTPDGIAGMLTMTALNKAAGAPAPVASPPAPQTAIPLAVARRWPHDDLVSKNQFYGNFKEKSWQAEYMVRITFPFIMRYDGKPINGFLCNKKCADAMRAAFIEIWDACGHDQAKMDATGASDFGGCFNIRPIAGSNNYSNHSWAAAVDLAPSSNGFRRDSSTTLPTVVIQAFKNQGAFWGGDYHGRKDPMHFEFVSR